MHYEMESRRFKNTLDENIRYGWNNNTQMELGYNTPISDDAINAFESHQDIDNEQLDSFEDLLKSPF